MNLYHALIAFCLISVAIVSSQPVAILLVLLSYGFVVLSSLPRGKASASSPVWLKILVFLGAVQSAISLLWSSGLRGLLEFQYEWCFDLAVIFIGILILDYAVDWAVTRPWRLPLMCTVYAGLGAGLIIAMPDPGIDVWHFQQNSSKSLLAGAHPYDISMPNPYSHSNYYGPGVLRENQVYGFPYPPLSLLLVVPGYLLGDVRWIMLAAHILLACTLVAIARRRGFPAGHYVEVIPLALLAQPGSLIVVCLAWTESLFATAMALLAFACLQSHTTFRWLALAAVFSVKQYSILLSWTLWKSTQFRGRDVILAAGLNCGVMLPFFLWNFPATWQSIVEFQFHQPLRPDSYSLNSLLLNSGQQPLPIWVSLGCVILIAAWVGSRRLAIRTNLCLTSAAILLTLFVTTNVFINYLWIVSVLLMIGIVVDFPAQK